MFYFSYNFTHARLYYVIYVVTLWLPTPQIQPVCWHCAPYKFRPTYHNYHHHGSNYPSRIKRASVAYVSMSVCLACWGSDFWKSWPRNLCADTSSEYFDRVCIWRSSDQGQGHRSKNRVCVSCSRVVCLPLEGNLVFCLHIVLSLHGIVLNDK